MVFCGEVENKFEENEIEVDAGGKLVFSLFKMKNLRTLQSLGFRRINDFMEGRFILAVERNLHKEFWNDEDALTNLAFKVFPGIQKREI